MRDFTNSPVHRAHDMEMDSDHQSNLTPRSRSADKGDLVNHSVKIHRFHHVIDTRGNLTVGEFPRDLPFAVKRFFLIYDVPSAECRGEHAHLNCHQFLIAVKGSLRVTADDGYRRSVFVLSSPAEGLYLPPMTWGIQDSYTSDAVLLVFASEFYDPDDYVRDYAEFKRLANQAR